MNTVHVALASDQNYFPGLITTVTSIICSTSPDALINFFVLDGGLTDEAWRRLEVTARRYSRSVKLDRYPLDARRFLGLRPLCGSLVTYARLLLPDLLPGDRVIYVDTDILFLRDIVDLWNMPFDGAAAIAVQDQGLWLLKTDCPWLNDGIDGNQPYFNAGMMLSDLRVWRRLRLHDRAIDLAARDPEKCRFYDQTVLNYVLRGQVKMIDQSWNRMTGLYWNWWPDDIGLVDGEDRLNANIHYTIHKPWVTYQHGPEYRLWYRYHDVWCDTRFPAALEYRLIWSWMKRSLMKSVTRRWPTRSVLTWTLRALGRDWSLAAYEPNDVAEAVVRRVAERWRRERKIRMKG